MFGINISVLWLFAGLLAIAAGAEAYIVGNAFLAGKTSAIAKSNQVALQTVQNVGNAEAKGETELKKAPSIDAALKNKGWCDDCNSLLKPPTVAVDPPKDEPRIATTVPAVGEPWKADVKLAQKKTKKAHKRRPPKTALCEAFNICLAGTDPKKGSLK